MLGGGGRGGPSSSGTPWGFVLSAAAAILISYADRGNLATCILPMSESLKWGLGEQSLVLSSFFAGYAVTQVGGPEGCCQPACTGGVLGRVSS